jgi:hypothetical protein
MELDSDLGVRVVQLQPHREWVHNPTGNGFTTPQGMGSMERKTKIKQVTNKITVKVLTFF